MKEWEIELLRRAREITSKGEGKIILTVRRRADRSGVEHIIECGDISRFITVNT